MVTILYNWFTNSIKFAKCKQDIADEFARRSRRT